MYLVDHGFFRAMYNNLYALPGGLYRSSQPSPSQIRRYHRRFGLRTIVNLRGVHDLGAYALEARTCRELGIALVDHPLKSRDVPSRELIHATRELIESIEYPALVHCKSGADRVGLFSVLYCHFRARQPIEVAVRQLHWRYGHVAAAKTGRLDELFASYLRYARTQPISFIEWVDTVFDPEQVKSEHAASERGYGDWLIDTVLNRE